MTEIPEALRAAVGVTRHSDWLVVEQSMIDRFAAVTLDRQFIHVDPERAAAGPFGGTVAHGFLTLSLISHLQEQAGRVAIPGLTMTVNYGLDRVRFPHPVRSGSRIRLATTLAAAEAGAPRTIRLSHDLTVEIEGAPKPALVATWITLCFV